MNRQFWRTHLTWDNVTKAGLINFFSSLYFYLPIATLWYQSRGLTLMQIETLNGIGTITIFLTTIFTGIFADRYGRKSAIIIALLLQLSGEVIFLLSNSFPLFIICSITAGLGFSFWSGAFDALILDSIKAYNQESQIQRIIGSISAYKGLATILGAGTSSLIVSQLVPSRFTLAILLTIGSVSLALFTSLFIQEPQKSKVRRELSPRQLFAKSITLVGKNKKLGRLVILGIVTTPFTAYLISLYQPYFRNLNIAGFWFGATYAIGGLLVLLATKYAYSFEKKLGSKLALLLFTLLPGIFFGLMAVTVNPWFAMTFFCLNYGSAAFQEPLLIDYTNRHIASENRATVLSFIAMLSSLYVALMGPLIGRIADFSIPWAFLLMGGIIISGALIFRIDESHVSV